MREQICPHCGEALPEEASFCPHCTRDIHQRKEWKPRRVIPRKVLYAVAALVVLAVLAVVIVQVTGPRTYDSGEGAEVTYTDRDGTYRLLLSRSGGRLEPENEIPQSADAGEQYRFPVCLYVNYGENDTPADTAFMKKVESITAEFLPQENGESPITCTPPEPHDYAEDAAAVSFMDYKGADFAAQAVWTIQMKNGDTIRLHQTIRVELIDKRDYFPDTSPMGTTEELQALLDEIERTVDGAAVVNIHLPPVTYGSLTIRDRPVNLFGSVDGDRRTTITNTLKAISNTSWIIQVENISFEGSGGMGISSSARMHVRDCTFTGWKTAVTAYGNAWVNIQESQFENNEVGFHFNSDGLNATHTQYTGNRFLNNGTAVLLESVPTDLPLHFNECQFSGNGTDIDNRCGREVDVDQATFE